MSLKSLAITSGQAIVSAALIAAIVPRIDYSRFLLHWSDLGLGVIVCSLALLAGQMTLLAGMRLKLVLATLGARVPLRRTSAIALCGFFFEQVAFGFVGGDGIRLWLLRRSNVPLRSAVGAVLIDRSLGLAGIVLLVLLGLWGLIPLLSDVDQRIIIATLGVFVASACAAFAGLAMLPDRWRRLPLVGDLSQLLVAALRSGTVRTQLLVAFALASATHLSNVLVISLVGHALRIPISLEQWFVIVPAVLLFSMLPISAGGWGVREGAMVIALHRMGVAPDAAVVPSIVFGLGILIVTLPGGVLWLSSRRSRSTETPQRKPKLSPEVGL